MRTLRQAVGERRLRRSSTARLSIAALALVGGLGTGAMWRQASTSYRNAQHARTAAAGAALRAEAERLMSALQGASGLAADGKITDEEFRAYSNDVLRAGDFVALGLVLTVADDRRAAFEAGVGGDGGGPILERQADGSAVAAARRDMYFVLVRSAPASSASAKLVGYDIAVDAQRRTSYELAADTRAPVLSAPVQGLATGRPSLLLVSPLLAEGPAGAAPTEFVVATVQIDKLVGHALDRLPSGTSLWVRDADVTLTGTAQPERPLQVDVAGRTWTVAAGTGSGPSRRPALLIGASTTAGVLALLWLSRRDALARHREHALLRRLALDRARTEALAVLARAVAVAHDVAGVAHAAARHAPAVVAAHRGHLGVLDAGTGALRLIDGEQPGSGPDDHRGPNLPLRRAASHRVTVLLGTAAEITARFPQEGLDAGSSRINAMAAVPLVDPSGLSLGAIGFSWLGERGFDDEQVAVLSAIADLCAQALSRATLGELRERKAQRMADLSQALAAARHPADLGRAATDRVCALFDAADAYLLVQPPGQRALVRLNREPGPARPSSPDAALSAGAHPACDAMLTGRPHFAPDATGGALGAVPVHDATGVGVGVLVVQWRAPVVFDTRLRSELATAADLIGQTLERAALYEAEHGLVVSLQRRILRPLPRLDGLQIAAHYRPASRDINMGGDWYDVVQRDDRTTLIVGDVVGHGLDAIARMAEMRSLLAGLLNAGTPLGELFTAVTSMLDRRDPTYATVQLLEIDQASATLRHLSAGHPPAVLRVDGATRALEGGRSRLLGVSGPAVEPAVVRLRPGSLVLAYTDGLIERRGETIDAGISRLTAVLDELDDDRSLDATMDAVVDRCAAPDSNFDDIVALGCRVGVPAR